MTTADSAAALVEERLKELYQLIHQIQEERVKNEHKLNNISRAHEKVNQEDKMSPYYQKLRNLYSAAVADGEIEEELIRKALTKIYEIQSIRNERSIQSRHTGISETIRIGALMKMLQSSALTLPIWVGQPGEKPPPLCGAIPADPNYIAKVGDMVAALVRGPEEGENWILAEVVSYNTATGKYEVDDIYEQQKDRHQLSRRRVVPLPLMRASPESDPQALFPKGSIVMALYPQTTCFYKAVVNQLPVPPSDEYEVLFEDPSYAEGYSPPLSVAQRYVISIRDRKSKGTQAAASTASQI